MEFDPKTILDGNKLSSRALPSLKNSGEKKIFLFLYAFCTWEVNPTGTVDLIMIGNLGDNFKNLSIDYYTE